ncbi:endonuclease V [Streptomyces calidiresistens]|uniref:Endonuclease V n=1 Tax=Streptomyces calidiresistens TaxID=1485586 RepID=A0A7W3T2E1_9ACTN|nr:endonuclease V [Streptomyces calidiresistens]MBB0229695.1 endonuclease V [Streptomyces calidiresistens]
MPAHTTPADAAEAVERQLALRRFLLPDEPGPPPGAPGTVTGVDVAYAEPGADGAPGLVAAAAVVLDAADLTEVDRAVAVGAAPFPYVPGLLAYRELPAVLEALAALDVPPGLVVCDGYGVAHPRRFGLTCHLGVLTGLRTIGVAKTPFRMADTPVGPPQGPPGPERGDHAPLYAPAPGSPGDADATPEVVGSALRTRRGVKPVYVSAGHRVGLAAARAHTFHLTRGFRLPETTRRADRACRDALARARAELPTPRRGG